MQLLSTIRKGLSRRHFLIGAAATAIVPTAHAKSAGFKWRLGLSQPLDSPNFIRLQEMAAAIRRDTNGALQIEVHGAGALGSDSKMLEMLQKGELELYNAGNVLGPIAPVAEMPGLPFTFKSPRAVFRALDGDLGEHIHDALLPKGIYTFRYWLDNGFHHLTTSTKPIRTVEDLRDMTIRTPVQKMTVDFFETLGAKPKTFTLNQLYQVLKDKTCDGQTDPLGLITLMKLYEVQTYLSLTNHWWSGFTFTASTKAWNTLPADMKRIVRRHAKTMALAQRKDVAKLTSEAIGILKSKGMVVNECDTSGFKKPLAGFYARWKAVYGDKAWAILEDHVGKLV